MMRWLICLMLLPMALAACGVKGPLMRPADVPAYEAERAKARAEQEAERQHELKGTP